MVLIACGNVLQPLSISMVSGSPAVSAVAMRSLAVLGAVLLLAMPHCSSDEMVGLEVDNFNHCR